MKSYIALGLAVDLFILTGAQLGNFEGRGPIGGPVLEKGHARTF